MTALLRDLLDRRVDAVLLEDARLRASVSGAKPVHPLMPMLTLSCENTGKRGGADEAKENPFHLLSRGSVQRCYSNEIRLYARRAARSSAKSWLTEAPLRMLMNNLDPEVAERPEDLVVYGGIGKAARNWECYDAIVAP